MDEVVKDILDNNLIDYVLLDQTEVIMNEMGCFDKILKVMEQL
jgi:hypothetical protein